MTLLFLRKRDEEAGLTGDRTKRSRKAQRTLKMYSGNYSVAIDDRGRMRIPNKLRDLLGENIVMCPGGNEFLLLMNDEDVEQMLGEKVNSSLLSDEEEKRDLLRMYMSLVFGLSEDKQKRFVIPPVLREVFGEEKNVVCLGMGKKIEVWPQSVYDKRFPEKAKQLTYSMLVKKLGI